MTVLKWLAGLVCLAYLGMSAALFFAQRVLLYPIPTTTRTPPGAAGFPLAEEHVLTTADGEQVIVWHVAAKPGRQVVLYFPGNGDSLAGSVGRFRAIASDGTGLVALSYRGYAGSSGAPSEQGLLRDAAAAYAFASALYAAERLVAWGFSLGSGVAVALAAEHPLGGLILEAPYSSIADVAVCPGAVFSKGPVSLRPTDRTRDATAPGHARRAGRHDSHTLRRAAVCAGRRAEAIRAV
jgi:uncharacterized protein